MLVDIQDIETIPSSDALDVASLGKKKAEAPVTSAAYCLMDLTRV